MIFRYHHSLATESLFQRQVCTHKLSSCTFFIPSSLPGVFCYFCSYAACNIFFFPLCSNPVYKFFFHCFLSVYTQYLWPISPISPISPMQCFYRLQCAGFHTRGASVHAAAAGIIAATFSAVPPAD